MNAERERFVTTLKPELKHKLKLIAVKRKTHVNELIEEWIQNLRTNEK